ncbi:hypothetical protein N865_17545 [Intrasporangium oryzae NRRL B-24470]|uniref:Uncharacterized protein n=1 Tax=Intrasporangium oryzae NRRL B-24470 TaxID=1386089 RepID=W9G5Z5_9MICO|nr:hypothetical protein [Intrasporangium oryzae]EWT00218.1 hypothetical protein N865_17545 [Intrasporangium oryzae NRRL B-24470]
MVVLTAVITYLAAHAVFVQLNDLLRGDIKLHNEVVTGQADRSAAGYTIYYLLLSWVAGGSTSPEAVRVASETLLASAMAAKAVVTLLITRVATRTLWPSLAVTAFLMVYVPVDLTLSPEMYFGRLMGSIWHNSTTVVLIPVSMLLFFVAVTFLVADAPGRAYWIAAPALIVLDGLLKPNYLLALLPALALLTGMVMLRRRRTTRTWLSTAPPVGRFLAMALPAAVLLVTQYVLAYQDGGVAYTNGIRPFATWSLLASYVPGGIPVVLLETFLLPALVTVLLWRQARRSAYVLGAWLVAGIATAQFAIFAEFTASGALLTHGNWSWGGDVAVYVLYTAVAILWVRHSALLPLWARALVYVVAATYLASGVIYLVHLVTPDGPGYH